MPYSDDLRQKLVEAWQAGYGTQAELAECFGVSLSWVEKVLRRWRVTGQTVACPFRHGPLPSIPLARLERLVQQHPAATLSELGRRFRVSAATVHRALARLDLPRKKRHCMPANATRLVWRGCVRVGDKSAVIWTRVN
jgi:transposase